MAARRGGYLLLDRQRTRLQLRRCAQLRLRDELVPGRARGRDRHVAEARGYWIAFANARAYALSPNARAPHCSAARTSASRQQVGAGRRRPVPPPERRAARPRPRAACDGTRRSPRTRPTGARSWARRTTCTTATSATCSARSTTWARTSRWAAGACSAGALHINWMHSQDHRDNILSPGFRNVGIGVYCAPNGSIWATQEFGRPSSAGPPPAVRRQHRGRTRSPGRNPTTRAADRGPGADPDARAVLDPSPGRSRAEGRSRMS